MRGIMRGIEHLLEDGVGELVEEGERAVPFGAEFVGLVEDGRDSTLLGEGREGDLE